MKEPKVAIYIRLSMADDDTRRSKEESDSVQHQRLLIHEFLNRHQELKDAPRTEFVDDGFTGTNTDRPAFQNTMKKLRSGELNVLVTKDFSRAMRDYTEMGNYLECVFPFLGVRYISINDGYDSNDYKGVTSGMDVVIRNIVYASYSKDLSVKTTTAKLQMMKQGKYVGSIAPYGYRFHPTIRNKLAIDPESASVVRRIFDLALAGKKTRQIAEILNIDGILTPGSYFRLKHPDQNRFQKRKESNGWNYHTVLGILHQYEYTGATVGHKRSKAAVNVKKSLPNNKEDWIVVENMHEAIVTHEEFQKVQEILKFGKTRGNYKLQEYPLKGVVRCAECHRIMTRRTGGKGAVYYLCDKSASDPGASCPREKHFMETDIERIVLHAIQQMLALYQQKENQKSALQFTRAGRINAGIAELTRLQQLQERYRQEKLNLYESYIAGDCIKERYLKKKAEIDKTVQDLEEDAKKQEMALATLEKEAHAPENPLRELSSQYQDALSLTKEMVQAFVQDVYIYQDSQVEIVWKFKDCFAALMENQAKTEDNLWS